MSSSSRFCPANRAHLGNRMREFIWVRHLRKRNIACRQVTPSPVFLNRHIELPVHQWPLLNQKPSPTLLDPMSAEIPILLLPDRPRVFFGS